jgi:sugar lactone lactonase YvrE
MLDLSTLPNVPMVRTTTQLVASANPQVQGQAVMFTATVSANSGGVVPTGKVAFTADGILQATVALSATGQAVFTAPKLVTGNHSIVATYSGGASFLRSAASLTESISQPLTATPAFSLAAGSYVGTQKVTVTDATSGATIYYTTNAAVPTTSSTVYSGPVTIGQSETLKAIAVASGHVASAVMAAQYILSPPAPQFSPGAGTYTREEVVTISDSLPMTTLYYTTDGTTPTTASTVYSGPVPVAFDQTLKAIATRANWANSAVGTASYSITGALVPNVISTIAGNGTQGYAGDGGPALQAEFAFLAGLAYDAAGNLYIADSANEVVRKVTPAGIVSTFAGNGTAGHAGDGGSAAQAQLYYPLGVAVDAAGDVFIADSLNNAIRKVTPSGIISTVAGNFNEGYTGDGGAATKATLRGPSAVAVSATGSLFIADTFNHAIRKVYPNGEIITYAGTGKQGYTGNGGAANRATLYLPAGVALDAAGNLYIADTSNCAIRKVSPALVITTIAGYSNSSGTVFCSDTGDGGPGVNATFNFPTGVVSDAAGNLFVADPVDNVVRAVSAKGVVTTIAGNGVGGFAGDGDEALSAELELYVEQQANGLALDAMGNLAIGDGGNERVRKVTFVPQTAAPAFSLAAGTYSGAQTVTLTDATKNATIYYTTDGSVPTPSSTKYAGSLSVSKTETLRAVAVSAGAAQSDVSMAAYTIQ